MRSAGRVMNNHVRGTEKISTEILGAESSSIQFHCIVLLINTGIFFQNSLKPKTAHFIYFKTLDAARKG